VLRPIDSNISIFNTEQRASQVKDPSAHHVQTLQQDEIAKRTQHEAQSVQPADKTDEDVKIKERKDDRNKEDRRNKKRREASAMKEAPEEKADETGAGGGRFDFLA
jgi:hypothetical protein